MGTPRKRLALAFFAAVSVLCVEARADDIYDVVITKRQEQKKLSKWSLSEWLETKNRMRLMDMWLAIHTPTPYEFYLGGNYQFASKGGDPYNGGQFHIAAFATIFGLEFQVEQSAAKIMNALFNMRLFGHHNQTTNITLHGGYRLRGDLREHRSPVAGVTVTLYFTKFFGLDGMYRYIFNSSANSFGNRIYAQRYEAGGFIDFSFVRVYGAYFHEQELASIDRYQGLFPIRKGGLAGVRLFF